MFILNKNCLVYCQRLLKTKEITIMEFDSVSVKSFWKEFPRNTIKYKGTLLPRNFELIADSVENFEVRNDDIWVCSFLRTGTTWTQEIVWTIANDLDFKGAKVPLIERFPFLEVYASALGTRMMNDESGIKNNVEFIKNLPSPRFIKTHLPFQLLPRQLREREKAAKIVYVTRNPKDTCISNFYYQKQLNGYGDSFENFCKLFLQDIYFYAPFWSHVNSYWKWKNDEKIICLKYEDMKENLPSILKKIAIFLRKELDDKQIEDLKRHLSFSYMKNNPAVNREKTIKKISAASMHDKSYTNEAAFIRKGCVEQWKSEMSSELIKQFDDWTDEKLKHFSDLWLEF